MLACRLARSGTIGRSVNQQGRREMETLIGSALVFFILLVAMFSSKKRAAKAQLPGRTDEKRRFGRLHSEKQKPGERPKAAVRDGKS